MPLLLHGAAATLGVQAVCDAIVRDRREQNHILRTSVLVVLCAFSYAPDVDKLHDSCALERTWGHSLWFAVGASGLLVMLYAMVHQLFLHAKKFARPRLLRLFWVCFLVLLLGHIGLDMAAGPPAKKVQFLWPFSFSWQLPRGLSEIFHYPTCEEMKNPLIPIPTKDRIMARVALRELPFAAALCFGAWLVASVFSLQRGFRAREGEAGKDHAAETPRE